MPEIDVTLLIATLMAVGVGFVISKSWPLRLSISINVALIAWLVRGIGILNGDRSTAEDYLNGLTYATAGVEIIIAIVWVMLCSSLGTILRGFYYRLKASVQKPEGSGS